jgi:hypothetical protein
MSNETYNEVAARASLYAKLARVMSQLGRIPKTGHNKHFDYAFATDADISDAIRSKLAEEKVAFFAEMLTSDQETITRETKYGPKTTYRTVATFAFTFADGETGATMTTKWSGESLDEQDKGLNKAATAALKYFLLKTFILSTGDPKDDPDEDVNTSAGTPAPLPFAQDKARITAFVARMADAYGVTAPEIVKALGVTRFGEYTGSEDDAEATVAAWVKPEAAAPAEAAKPAAKANGKPAADAKAPDWTPEIAQGWANMLKWAAENFDYDEDGVLLLLNDVQPPVLSKKDWRGTTMQARGAVIAGFCEYDVTRIDAWCDKAQATDELRGRAKDMAEAYKLAAAEVR